LDAIFIKISLIYVDVVDARSVRERVVVRHLVRHALKYRDDIDTGKIWGGVGSNCAAA
jgi:hypothetical protein